MQLLHEFIKSWLGDQTSYPKVIFDNARIHLTLKVKKLCSYLRFEINSLPVCSPQLAHAETVFDISKRRIQRQCNGESKNFGKLNGKRVMLKYLKSLSIEAWLKIWRRFVRIAKMWIIHSCEAAGVKNKLMAKYKYCED